MRKELKFRAWNNYMKIMEEDVLVQNGMRTKYVESSHEGPLGTEECFGKIQYPKDNLMQYTGLKDKNGKEIYEGDIVKTFSRTEVVEFGAYEDLEDDFGLYTVCGCVIRDYDRDDTEVIGNVYENPSLINN